MNDFKQRSKLFLDRNAPTILTCLGGLGVIATAVLAAVNTPKAVKRIEQAEAEKGEELTKVEKVIAATPAYGPTILAGTTTLVCIFGANALNKRQQAALVSAYAFLDNSFKEYREKVQELYGEEADERVHESIAKDHYEEEVKNDEEDDGLTLFWDSFSKRWFRSTLEKVMQAEYEMNRDLTLADCVSVNQFYEYLGLPLIENGDDYGWSAEACFAFYGHSWIEFSNKKTDIDDDMECYIISMGHEPVYRYYDY